MAENGKVYEMIFENFDRIVFAGDSVTDMGSVQPVGEGLFDNMGRGYPRVIENMIASVYPELSIRFTNSGISGNTSKDLLNRFQRDVIDLNPDWVSICIGINDVWRQYDTPAMTDYAVSPDEYEANMRKMIEAAKQTAKGNENLIASVHLFSLLFRLSTSLIFFTYRRET